MVRFNLPVALSLKALSTLVTALPIEEAHNTTTAVGQFIASFATLDAEKLDSGLFTNASLIEYNLEVFPKDGPIIPNLDDGYDGPLSAEEHKRSLARRFPVEDWQDVRGVNCWDIAGYGVDYSRYWTTFLNLANAFDANGRAQVDVGPNRGWVFNVNNLHFEIRNQNQCAVRRFWSNDIAQMMWALWYRCQNNAAGFTYYTWMGIDGNPIWQNDFIMIVHPTEMGHPGYNPTCSG
ncbi:hypothetical protein B0I35DRAFT_476170 [Stachybotrys elegans]|uniref:Uncharacterized protein n=1 Tax=Stachybotrys elegans TaxID=80388 RepID=A0A8K0SXX9_9HYPO|nr:hypothetical protein B0I35DRAFT_476170 [Stachybotrys elegans]